MAKKVRGMLTDLTTAQLKNLLAARERIDVLEKEKVRLLKELAGVEKELKRIMSGAVPAGRGRPRGAKKAAKKTAKKTVRRKVAKKAPGRKKVAKKAPAKQTRRPAAGRAARGGTLEEVILGLLQRKGTMAFKDLHATIVKEKLYKSKATKFENVLRRTLSTSKKIKRVGRGIYAAA